ncbi:30S ribosomal protein S4, partial [Candidatus Peregrinibacteria bacterium]|nr:30S ribosomal protein S4 [Candidatus Peregrinibacteria bacterium]
NYYKLATKSKEITGIKFLQLLEQRLDNVIYRAGMANTRPQARQIVNHGLVMLNGRRVKTPSIQVKPGDKFQIREKSKVSKLFEEIKKSKPHAPKWIQADPGKLEGEITSIPDKDDMEQIIEHQLITEFYSK